MSQDLGRRILKLFPNADLLDRVIVQDDSDGRGPYIKKWDTALGAQPTPAQLAAVDVTVTPDEKTDAIPFTKREIAALFMCVDASTKPVWVQNQIQSAINKINAARS